MTFGEKLKELRTQAGMTQAQLAEISDVPLGTIRDYEQGKRNPLLSTAQKLARALNQPLDVFPQPQTQRPRKAAGAPSKAQPAVGSAGKPAKDRRSKKATADGTERKPKSNTGK